MRSITIALLSVLCSWLISCSNSSPDKKIIGTWKSEMTEKSEGMTANVVLIHKYAADKTFIQTGEITFEGETNKVATATGMWRIEGNQLFWEVIGTSDEKQTGKATFDIVQIGENSLTLRKDGKTIIYTKVQ